MGHTDLKMKINAAQIMNQQERQRYAIAKWPFIAYRGRKGREKSSTQVQGNKHIFSPIHHV